MATINCIWKNSIWNWCISFELQKERKSGNARSLPHSCYHHHREILLENVLMIQFGLPEQKWSEHMTSAVFLLVTLFIVLPPGRRSCLRCLWLFYCDSFTQGCREPAAPSTNGRVQFLFAWLWTLVMKKMKQKIKLHFFWGFIEKKMILLLRSSLFPFRYVPKPTGKSSACPKAAMPERPHQENTWETQVQQCPDGCLSSNPLQLLPASITAYL